VNAALKVNGKDFQVSIEPNEMLITTLRNLGFKSVKHGCDSADCGSCTVLLNGKAILSCSTFTASVDGGKIITAEGLSEGSELSNLQKTFTEESAFQCGFCAPGLLMTTTEILNKYEKLNEDEIKYHFSGNLCRCTGYESQLKTIKRLFEEKNNPEGDSDE